MAHPRFYISPEQWVLERLTLAGDEAHHCREVLRVEAGGKLVVFNGLGHEATAEIATVAKERVELRVLQHFKAPRLGVQIELGQAIPKGKNMDLIVEKATELGAAAVIPLLSERTVVQLDAAEGARKREKWQRVAIEAAKQCGQNWLPEIAAPAPIKTFFETARYDLMLIASLQPGARHLKEVLAEVGFPAGRAAANPQRVLVLVGPEGDFTPAEINLAKTAGCRPMTLGPIILRTETAAIYCLSVLSHELFAPLVHS